jgi:hypothetical protein
MPQARVHRREQKESSISTGEQTSGAGVGFLTPAFTTDLIRVVEVATGSYL